MKNYAIVWATFLKASQPKKSKYTILFQSGIPSPTKGKGYTIICENSLVFTKEQILELPDKQAALLLEILKLRKQTKKLEAYEANFKKSNNLKLNN